MKDKIASGAKLIMIIAAVAVIILEVIIVITTDNLISSNVGLTSVGDPLPVQAKTIEYTSEDPSYPENIKVVNLSDASFDIFFTTQEKTNAYLQVGPNKVLKWEVLDVRDTDKAGMGEYYNHYFTFTDPDAIAESIYSFRIIMRTEIYDNDGDLYSVQLPPILSSPPSPTTVVFNNEISTSADYSDFFLLIRATDGEGNVISNYAGQKIGSQYSSIDVGTLRQTDLSAYTTPENFEISIYNGNKLYTNTANTVYDVDTTYKLTLE